LEQKNDIKESSGPNQLILEHWFQKTWFFITKVDIEGGGRYLPYISQKQVKQALLFKTAHTCLFCDKKTLLLILNNHRTWKISQQDSHNFHQSS
jgi:hypothetical protein